jgi:hypothetical protein
MNRELKLIVLHPWPERSPAAQWLASVLGAAQEAWQTKQARKQGGVVVTARLTAVLLPGRPGQVRTVSALVAAASSIAAEGGALAEVVRQATHIVVLDAGLDHVVGCGAVLEALDLRDKVVVFDVRPDVWLAACSPFGEQAVRRAVRALEAADVSLALLLARSPAQFALGRRAGFRPKLLWDQVPSVPCPDQPERPLHHHEPTAWLREAAREEGIYAGGSPPTIDADALQLAVLAEAVSICRPVPSAIRERLPHQPHRPEASNGISWVDLVLSLGRMEIAQGLRHLLWNGDIVPVSRPESQQ